MKLGKYQHYKGGICEIMGIAKHSETLEEMIVYTHFDPVKGEKKMSLRVRPKKMFEESITIDGNTIQRFTYIGG